MSSRKKARVSRPRSSIPKNSTAPARSIRLPLQNLPVTFCLDRAGLSPNYGPTHHGLFDLAYLRCVPNVVVMQPKDEDELVDMLHTGLTHPGPAFIRYPRGAGLGKKIKSEPA